MTMLEALRVHTKPGPSPLCIFALLCFTGMTGEPGGLQATRNVLVEVGSDVRLGPVQASQTEIWIKTTTNKRQTTMKTWVPRWPRSGPSQLLHCVIACLCRQYKFTVFR